MGEGYPDMAGWGVTAIFKEAARLVRSYMRLLHPFIAAFLVPVALLVLLEVLALAFMAPHDDAPPPFSAFLHHHSHHSHHRRYRHDHSGFFNSFIASLKASENYQRQPPSPLVLTLIYVAFTIAIWLLASLATAAIATAVNSIYSTSNENPSTTHVKAIFKSLPAAFFRMFITSLWILLLDLTLNAAVTLFFFLLSLTNTIPPQLLLSLLQGSLLLTVLAVDFLFILSQQVAVLEPENYGVVAVKRGVKLVQAKVPTALTLFVIYSGFGVLFSWIVQTVALFGSTNVGDGAEVYVAAVVVAGGYLAFATYWLVVTTVFYFVSRRECGDGDERAFPNSENAYRPINAVSA